jgi:tryptophanyl-tRNA synthetase
LHPENINAGLLTYPVLQTADIILHRATWVPVGKDQEQHLEMARNFVKRFNHRYNDVFPEPMAYNFGDDLVKVPSLDGSGKMSKSENQMATLYLADEDDLIRKKVMKAKTDGGPTSDNMPKPDYIENFFLLMKLVSKAEVVKFYEEAYNNCSIRYGDMKKQLAEDMVAFIAPIREKAASIQHDDIYLSAIMKQGAEKARVSAEKTMELVRTAMASPKPLLLIRRSIPRKIMYVSPPDCKIGLNSPSQSRLSNRSSKNCLTSPQTVLANVNSFFTAFNRLLMVL